MTTFIETDCGAYINLNSVRRFRPERHKHGGTTRLVAYLDDGTKYECAWSAASVEKLLAPVIPAQPGFALLTVYFWDEPVPDDLAGRVNHAAIVGWRMTEFSPVPVTLEDFDGASEQAIKCPDGQIIMPDDRSFQDMDGFLREMRARWQKYLDQRAAKAVTAA